MKHLIIEILLWLLSRERDRVTDMSDAVQIDAWRRELLIDKTTAFIKREEVLDAIDPNQIRSFPAKGEDKKCSHEHINYNGIVIHGLVYDVCEDCGTALVEKSEDKS